MILIDPRDFGADRENVRLALEKENIESRPVWKPMHLQPVFQGAMERMGDLSELRQGSASGKAGSRRCRVVGGKVSEALFEKGLCLPSGTAMSADDLERIVETILRCQKGN